jgi:hypothetical protein
MKKLKLSVLGIALSCFVFAQEKVNEIGVVFSNLNDFGVTYRFGNEKSLWRFDAVSIYANNNTKAFINYEELDNAYGFDVRVGKEFRKKLNDKISLSYGADISFGYEYTVDGKDYIVFMNDVINEYRRFLPGINLIIGVNYDITNKLSAGAELLPGGKYYFGKYKNIQNAVITTANYSGFQSGINNKSVEFSLRYKF